jgi:hypothetical protein
LAFRACPTTKSKRSSLPVSVFSEWMSRRTLYPNLAHLLGLNVARLLRRRGERNITIESVRGALERTAREVDEPLDDRVNRAFEAGGEVQPRKRILEVLAHSSKARASGNRGHHSVRRTLRPSGQPGVPPRSSCLVCPPVMILSGSGTMPPS